MHETLALYSIDWIHPNYVSDSGGRGVQSFYEEATWARLVAAQARVGPGQRLLPQPEHRALGISKGSDPLLVLGGHERESLRGRRELEPLVGATGS